MSELSPSAFKRLSRDISQITVVAESDSDSEDEAPEDADASAPASPSVIE